MGPSCRQLFCYIRRTMISQLHWGRKLLISMSLLYIPLLCSECEAIILKFWHNYVPLCWGKYPQGTVKTPFTMKLTNRCPVLNPNRKYEEALEYHRQALVLIPQNASTYSAIGYIHSLMGNFESAIDYFHTVRNWLHLEGWSQLLFFTVPLWFGFGAENQPFFPASKCVFIL